MKILSKADGVKKVKSMQKTGGARIYKVKKVKTNVRGKNITMYNLYTKNTRHSSMSNPYGLEMMRDGDKAAYLIPVNEDRTASIIQHYEDKIKKIRDKYPPNTDHRSMNYDDETKIDQYQNTIDNARAKRESVNELQKMRPAVKKLLKQKGYAPIFQAIDNSKRQFKQMRYSRGEIQDTLIDMFGDEDPKILQKIKESVNEDVYYGYYKNKEIKVNAKSDSDAKKQIVSKLKVPMTQWNRVSMTNHTKNKKNRHKFESIYEVKIGRYDIGMGSKGNGITLWNRNVEKSGDYKSIAHIDNNGKITNYEKRQPKEVTAFIQKIAKGMKDKPKGV